MKSQAIIFDWSGTISDDIMIGYAVNMRMLRDRGLPEISFAEWKRFAYGGSAHGFLTNFGIQADEEETLALATQYTGEEIAAGNIAAIYQDAKETILHIRNKGIKMAVLSRLPQGHLESDARRYGIHKYFEVIRSCKDKARYIPIVCKKIGVLPENTWYVGDEAADIIAARAAGAFPVAVASGYSTKEKLQEELGKDLRPGLLLDRLSDLMISL